MEEENGQAKPEVQPDSPVNIYVPEPDNNMAVNQVVNQSDLSSTQAPVEIVPPVDQAYLGSQSNYQPISADINNATNTNIVGNVSMQRLGVKVPITNTSTNDQANVATDTVVKKKYFSIITMITSLVLILVGLLMYFDNPYALTYKQNLYIDMAKTCPALKNNIAKVKIDSTLGHNVVITKSGDLFYFFGFGDIKSSGYNTGDCVKINEVSNAKDAVLEFLGITVLLNDNTIKSYTVIILDKKVTVLESRASTKFPLSDAKYYDNVAKYNVKQYFYLDDNSDLFFIDSHNNVYDEKFNKYIDGSVFDSDIIPVTSYDKSQNIIFASKKYIYEFNNTGKLDTTGGIYKFTDKATLKKKLSNFYGVKASDIKQINFEDHFYNDVDSFYNVMTNDGNVYRFVENKLTTSDYITSISSASKYIYIIGGISIAVLVGIITLSYRGERKKYSWGLIRAFFLMVFLNIVTAIFGLFVIGKSVLSRYVSIKGVFSIIIATFVYFTFYFIMKKIVWAMMHKANVRSKVLFAIVYLLSYSIVMAIIVKNIYHIVDFIKSII